ncbi:uncharacterized protein LOC110992823 [Pieris rapae]|uniref:uncharacterized protein LOC110992823 n=1 Tax=Pieris rapae TaxID=64459 RepID=UPI001E27EB07|nr:uncharacterized protein LOC110992823 [Pieris rapae]
MKTMKLLTLLVISVIKVNANTVPVFLLDYESVLPHVVVEPNPFNKVDTSSFFDIIHEAIRNSKVVIMFVEEKFSTEDISIKDEFGSPFQYLKQGLTDKKIKYIPKVIEPYKLLKQVFQHQKNSVYYVSSTSNKIQIRNGRQKHFYIYFKDSANDTRVNTLRRHDMVMQEIYFVIRRIASGPVVGFYTGKMNPVVIRKINILPPRVAPRKQVLGVTVTSTGALFRLFGVYSTVGSRRSSFSQSPLVTEERWARRQLNIRMAYTDFELEFTFSSKPEGWIAENVALLEWGEEVGHTKLGVAVPWEHSYICGEPLTIVNTRDGSAVIISQYQLQSFQSDVFLRNSSGGNNTHCFGPAIHCGPYFNSRILSGLMVSFLCLGILTYGILILYNCNSNDRYDDAQGKPLVIASDMH